MADIMQGHQASALTEILCMGIKEKFHGYDFGQDGLVDAT